MNQVSFILYIPYQWLDGTIVNFRKARNRVLFRFHIVLLLRNNR